MINLELFFFPTTSLLHNLPLLIAPGRSNCGRIVHMRTRGRGVHMRMHS